MEWCGYYPPHGPAPGASKLMGLDAMAPWSIQVVCVRTRFSGRGLVILALLIGCLGSGCIPTPYKRDSSGEGYAESQISPNKYRVTFTGNRRTSRRKIENYLSYRCAELTLAEGYNSFALTERVLITADGAMVDSTWNASPPRPYRAILVGGWEDAVAKGALLGLGASLGTPWPHGSDSRESMGGGAQAVIEMFDQPNGALPQSPDLSDDVVYDARGVMRVLQQFDNDLFVMESNRLSHSDTREPVDGLPKPK